MKVYNQDKTQLLEVYDLAKGYLVPSTRLVRHIPYKAPEIEFHYEEVNSYENGGKDFIKVIDKVITPEEQERDEYEDIAIYIPYTEQELTSNKIQELKEWFDIYYTQHEQKYRRLITLQLRCDDGTDPTEQLKSLYREAEQKRKEIQSLEGGNNE